MTVEQVEVWDSLTALIQEKLEQENLRGKTLRDAFLIDDASWKTRIKEFHNHVPKNLFSPVVLPHADHWIGIFNSWARNHLFSYKIYAYVSVYVCVLYFNKLRCKSLRGT